MELEIANKCIERLPMSFTQVERYSTMKFDFSKPLFGSSSKYIAKKIIRKRPSVFHRIYFRFSDGRVEWSYRSVFNEDPSLIIAVGILLAGVANFLIAYFNTR